MLLRELKAKAQEIADKLPYQHMSDSPTIRQYINWSQYEGYDKAPRAVKAQAAPCEILVINGLLSDAGPCEGVRAKSGADLAVMGLLELDSKILAKHILALEEVAEVELSGTPGRPVVVRAAAEGEGAHAASHILLNVRRGFKGDLALIAEGRGNVLNTTIVEGRIEDGAELNLAFVSAGDRGASYVRGELVAGAGVALKLSPMATGGRANALHEEYVLAGPGATAEGVGLELGAGDSRIHHLISLINDGERTKSTVKLMAVSRDGAWVVQRALGRITKRGRWSESVVEGVTYIASKTAAAVTQPILYIETGDVSGARHSAADASLDEERAFYLRARGISEDELPTLVTLSLIDQYFSSISEKLVDIVKQYIKI